MKIIFESHATSIDNELGIASGHLDPHLSKKGIMQAKDLGKRYTGISFDVVFCSDLIRSKETAQTAFEENTVTIIADSRLREWNYGTYNGALASVVESLKKYYIQDPFPEGESLVAAVRRIEIFLDSLFQNYKCKLPILIIGHRVVYYALEHRFKKSSLEELVTRPWSWQPGWEYTF